jgi:hypothetical protein
VQLAAGSDVISSIVELCVGVVCLFAAAATWRRPGLRAWAGVFLIAGLAAAIHAVVSLF